MVFLYLPDMPPAIVDVRPAYVLADASAQAGFIGNFGACILADDSGGDVTITQPFDGFIPERIRDDFKKYGYTSNPLGPEDAEWLANWDNSFTFKILRQPKHGMINVIRAEGSSLPNNPLNGHFGYMPEKGYLGKDRLDIQIEGKSPDGRPISARMNVYIRVISRDQYDKLLGNPSYDKYIKQNCPASTQFWKIISRPVTGALDSTKSGSGQVQ